MKTDPAAMHNRIEHIRSWMDPDKFGPIAAEVRKNMTRHSGLTFKYRKRPNEL